MKMKLKRAYFMHTTAELRRELKDPRTNRWMRCDVYAELLRRKRQS